MESKYHFKVQSADPGRISIRIYRQDPGMIGPIQVHNVGTHRQKLPARAGSPSDKYLETVRNMFDRCVAYATQWIEDQEAVEVATAKING